MRSESEMRARFEAWRKTLMVRPNLMRNGEDYEDYDTQIAWSGWQAALASQPQAPIPPHMVDGVSDEDETRGQIEFLDVQNHSLRGAIHAIMAKLVFLLDEDQFADIDAIALAAGVSPPSQPQAPAAAWPDLLTLAATFETCIPFLPSAGQKNITTAVESLRRIAMAPAAVVPEDVRRIDCSFLFSLIKECRSHVRRSGIKGDDYSLSHESRMLALRYENGDFDKAMEVCRSLAAAPAPGVDRG